MFINIINKSRQTIRYILIFAFVLNTDVEPILSIEIRKESNVLCLPIPSMRNKDRMKILSVALYLKIVTDVNFVNVSIIPSKNIL